MPPTTKSRKATGTKAVKAPSTVYIVGFAPSWEETPWSEPDAAYWGMNDLHAVKDAATKPWTRWYQLHDIDKHHPDGADTHIAWMNGSKIPVFMWGNPIDERVNNAVAYPKNEIVAYFGGYFTNSVSWMIAQAILEGYKKIGVYGVDMAQDSEYGHQRPSCEYFIGWARGLGIDIDIAPSSDLLKSPFLYGAESGGPMRAKFGERLEELSKRKNTIDGQLQQLTLQSANLAGALEDTRYYLRAWSIGEITDGPEPQPKETAS